MRTGKFLRLHFPALALLLCCLSASAGEVGAKRSLSIGTVTIALGSPTENVLRELSAKYKIRDLGDGDFLVIKEDGPGIIGGVKVHAGRVVRVSRDWVSRDTREAHALAESLWAVLAEATNDSEAPAQVVTRTVREPNDTYYDIQIIFSDRRVSLTSSKNGRLGLSETIEEPRK